MYFVVSSEINIDKVAQQIHIFSSFHFLIEIIMCLVLWVAATLIQPNSIIFPCYLSGVG